MRRSFFSSYFLLGAALVSCAAPRPGAPGTPDGDPAPVVDPAGSRGATLTGYSAFTRAYRLDSRDSLAMEMPDGSFQRTVTVKTAYLRFDFRGRGGALEAEIVLDSIVLDRPSPIFQPLADSARGIRWSGTIRRSGRLDSLPANRTTVFGEQVRAMLSRLLPILPDSGVAAGERWSDTLEVPFRLMVGFDASEVRAVAFRAGRWADSAGARSLPVESTMDYTVTGSGAGFGQEIRFSGSGQARGTHRLSAAGILAQARVTDSVAMVLTVPAIGQSVPAVVITSYTLVPLP